ncbi:uncharacterized protein LOC142239972 [Haematobia irritans]|uniref:uncharacterized protein LOC142239972 n=1 Tax=Haematobia irritans TaxID=7368 RepID=UPI003F50BE0A
MISILCQILLTAVFVAFYVWYKQNFGFWLKYRKIVASVSGRIFSGNLIDFLSLKTNVGINLKTIYDDPKFAKEPVVGIYGMYKPSLLIREPELIKNILIKDFDCFCERFARADPHHDRIGSFNMFFARYKMWKEVRSKLTPVFSSGKLKYMYPLLQQVGANLQAYIQKQGSVFRIEVKDLCARYTTDTTATTMFGIASNSLENPEEHINILTRKLGTFDWRRAFNIMIIFFAPRLTGLLRAKFWNKDPVDFLSKTLHHVIPEREQTGEKRNDLIDIMVKLKREATANGENIEDFMELMISQGTILLAGGYETSSSTISNTLFELAKNTDIQQKLRNEIRLAVEEEEGTVSYENLCRMEYMEMVIKETLRLYPVLPVLERKYGKASGPMESYSLRPYCDYDIPEGMPVYISAYGLHYDPQHWPNPTKYDPERFSPENKSSINPMVYLPFGNGPHNCIGGRLGMLQVKCGLLHLLENHYVRVCEETNLQPEIDPKAFIFQMKGGIRLEFVRDDMCKNLFILVIYPKMIELFYQILVANVIAASLCLCLWYRNNFRFWLKYKKSVASVPGRIFSGNLYEIIKFKTNLGFILKTIYDDPKFAKQAVVGVYGLYKPSLLIREPELIKRILIKDFESFCDRFARADPHHDRIASFNLFFARYKMWKVIRSKLSPVFSIGKLKYMYPLLQGVGENLQEYLQSQGSQFRIEVKDLCARYTTDTIGTTILGFASNSLENPEERFNILTRKLGTFDWKRAINTMLAFFAPKLCTIVRSKFWNKETVDFLTTTLCQVISERERSAEKRNDFIDIIVKLKKEVEANGEDIDKFMELMISQATILLAAGYETSSSTLVHILLELAKNPNIQKKLRKEIQLALDKGSDLVSYENFSRLEYMEMVINETLRLYPVLPMIDRMYGKASGSSESYSLRPYCDFDIPKGMPVYISVYGLHYDPQYWPNPTKYDPERFSAENKISINPMTYLPFGNGPHNCIGGRLAMLQVKCGLFYLLKNHYVRVCDGTMRQPEFDPKAFVFQLKGGIHLEFIKDDMCDKLVTK